MKYSERKEEIVFVLNIINKMLNEDITIIQFNSNRNNNTLRNDSQVIDITTTKHQVIRFLFDSCYVIKDEEFFIII